MRGNLSRVNSQVPLDKGKGHLGRVRVSTRAGLIQSVISADTSGKICVFPMIEGMNQETFKLYYPQHVT
jgi:hypothetical protein